MMSKEMRTKLKNNCLGKDKKEAKANPVGKIYKQKKHRAGC